MLPLNLSSLAWKALVQQEPDLADLEHTDLNMVKATEKFRDLESHDIPEEVFPHAFPDLCYEYADCQGFTRAVRPGGSDTPVTFDSAPRFMHDVRRYRMYEGWAAGQEVRRGMATIVPVDLMALWTWRDLDRMVADGGTTIYVYERSSLLDSVLQRAATPEVSSVLGALAVARIIQVLRQYFAEF